MTYAQQEAYAASTDMPTDIEEKLNKFELYLDMLHDLSYNLRHAFEMYLVEEGHQGVIEYTEAMTQIIENIRDI